MTVTPARKGTTAVMNSSLLTSHESQDQNTRISPQILKQQQVNAAPSLSLNPLLELEKQLEHRAPERVVPGATTEALLMEADNATSKDNDNIVGDYVLGETIGKGTFGKVKLGLHLLTGEQVAVKILEKKRIIHAADMDRVAREIKILKRNRHQNVIQLFEVIDSSDHIYLIMEHVDGGEMFEYIVAHRRLCEPEAAYLFRQIVDGVAYLHSNEVTHRDLKPENLLLQSNRLNAQSPFSSLLVKIVDFGLSNLHDGGRLLRTACGSPCYAAPEMIQGRLYCGPVADVWSLGVVLFAMVCGFLPFEDSNTNLLYKKILSANYTMPTFLSANVQDLVRRILETDPEKRYTIDQIRQHPWLAGVHPPTMSPFDVCRRGQSHEAKARHELILNQLEAVGLSKDDVVTALSEQLFNRFTASYYLFDSKFQRTTQNTIIPTPSSSNNVSYYCEEYTFNSDADRHRKSLLQAEDNNITACGSRNVGASGSSHSEQERHKPISRYNIPPHQPLQSEISGTQRPVTPNFTLSYQETGSGLAHRPKSMRGGRNLVIKNSAAEVSGAGYLPIAPNLPREHRHSGVLIARKAQIDSRVTTTNGMVALRPLVHSAHPPRRDIPLSTPRRHSTERQLCDPSRVHTTQPPSHISINSTNGGVVIRRRPQNHVPPLHYASRTQSPCHAPVRPTSIALTTELTSVSKSEDTRLPQRVVTTKS